MDKNFLNICNLIQGKKINNIGAAGDMLWISIGSIMPVISTYNGKMSYKGEYGLHLQCPWQFIDDNKVVLASSDFFIENNSESIFQSNLRKINLGDSIEGVSISELGDIIITCSGFSFYSFICKSSETESWRFIDNNQNYHYVFKEIENE